VILPVTELDRANAIFERILYTLPPEPERRPAKPLQRGHEVFREQQAPVRRQEQPRDKPRERQPPERKKPVLQPQEAPVRPPQPQREVSQRSEEQGRQQAPVTQRQVKEKNGSRSERDSHVIKISSSIPKESGTTRGTSERPSIEARLQGYRGQGRRPSAPAKVKAKTKNQAKVR
jgi:type IV secretory pathway VirB10-like protein